jgi:cyclophilin family peptidyl-prolyl cis-trans isomerase
MTLIELQPLVDSALFILARSDTVFEKALKAGLIGGLLAGILYGTKFVLIGLKALWDRSGEKKAPSAAPPTYQQQPLPKGSPQERAPYQTDAPLTNPVPATLSAHERLAKENQEGLRHEDLWLKCFTEAGGDTAQAEIAYNRERVAMLNQQDRVSGKSRESNIGRELKGNNRGNPVQMSEPSLRNVAAVIGVVAISFVLLLNADAILQLFNSHPRITQSVVEGGQTPSHPVSAPRQVATPPDPLKSNFLAVREDETKPIETKKTETTATAVKITLETSKGNIELELDAVKAPISTKNFVYYAKKGHYDGTIFHRVIPGFMVQGGGFDAEMSQKPTDVPIRNESKNGLKNARGTIAMARTNVPDSAASQFFINVNDNANLDYPSFDGSGYAVFGKVTAGMEVVDAILAAPTTSKGVHQNVPAEAILIKSAKVAE